MKVLLFSGGLDSTALAYWLRPNRLLFIDYGQIPAAGERRAATQIAKELDLILDCRTADCRSFGSGDMAGLPSLGAVATEFWPYRNQLLLTLGAMLYSAEPVLTLLIGTIRSDEIHPDGSLAFISKMQDLLSTQGNSRIEAPAIAMSSSALQQNAGVPISILSWAFSCHRATEACGQCRGCNKYFQTIPIG